jgi:Prealbumin-like fold domain
VNTSDVPAGPWGSRLPNGDATTTIPTGGWFEASLDLDGLGFAPGCPGFGQASAKSRSSDSIPSALMDLAGPFPIDLNTCGKITIEKDAKPNDQTDFPYTVSGTGLSAFSLDDDSGATGESNALSNKKEFTNVPPGSKVVRENPVPTGWTITNITCGTVTGSGTSVIIDDAAGVNPDDSDFDAGDDRVQITLGNLGEVSCKFENTLRLSLIIKKTGKDKSATGGTRLVGGATFTITPNPLTGSATGLDVVDNGLDTNDQFSANAGLVCLDNVLSGTYTIVEKTAPTGWAKDSSTKMNVSPASGTCSGRGTSAGPEASFVNDPLTTVTVNVTSLAGAGVTESTVQCTGESTATAVPPAHTTGSYTPQTVTCTIVIDP